MENSKIKNILVIDNHDSFVYNLVQILRENEHCQFDIVYNDQIDFSSLGNYDKILLSPGPGIPAEAGELLTCLLYTSDPEPGHDLRFRNTLLLEMVM